MGNREVGSSMVLHVTTKPMANTTSEQMIVIDCPDCPADFPNDDVEDECPECGGTLANGTISMVDYVIQCGECKERIGIQNIDREGNCPNCGKYSGFPNQNTDQ